ncbi:MAG: polysaccharide biosynthesis/export family protein [Flavobacteriales bacterium]
MFRNTSIYLFLVFLLSSCITNKDLDIFHTKDNSKINIVENKTIVSDGDLLYVEIKSLTPTNYDFFNKSQDNSTSRLVNPHIYGFLVNDSGYVSLPILGEIFVRGKSLEETEKTIKNVAKDYFSNPYVKVVLLNFNVTILGEVNSPGTKNIIEPSMNIIDVVGLANGFTSTANRKKIKVIRLDGEQPEIFYVDLTDLNTANTNKFFVKSGDVINIEPVKKRFFVINSLSSGLSVIISSLTLYFLLTNE